MVPCPCHSQDAWIAAVVACSSGASSGSLRGIIVVETTFIPFVCHCVFFPSARSLLLPSSHDRARISTPFLYLFPPALAPSRSLWCSLKNFISFPFPLLFSTSCPVPSSFLSYLMFDRVRDQYISHIIQSCPSARASQPACLSKKGRLHGMAVREDRPAVPTTSHIAKACDAMGKSLPILS